MDLAFRDASDVEQVFDQPVEGRYLVSDDPQAPIVATLLIRVSQELGGHADTTQRIPQLMGQDGDELVLPRRSASASRALFASARASASSATWWSR